MKKKYPARVAAIDAFRAITMYLMLFVNDISGLQNVPHWLKHAAADEDMMGFSDLIFPAFLFCVGLSVPYAIQARIRKGDDTLQILGHILWRTIALVVMGTYLLHGENVEGGMTWQTYTLLTVLGFFLLWNHYPASEGRQKQLFTALRFAGGTLLLFLLIDHDMHDNAIRTGWWGILGLIGWTYMVCALLYVALRGRFKTMLTAWTMVMSFSVLAHTNLLPWDSGVRYLLLPFVPSDWTLHALGVSGVMVGMTMQRVGQDLTPKRFATLLCVLAVVFLAAGVWAHSHWIISKIQATPAWMCLCITLFLPTVALLYWLTNIKGHVRWMNVIKPASNATLTCYLIPYVWLAIQNQQEWWYPQTLYSGVPGLCRSALFALLVVWIVGGLGKLHVRLKI